VIVRDGEAIRKPNATFSPISAERLCGARNGHDYLLHRADKTGSMTRHSSFFLSPLPAGSSIPREFFSQIAKSLVNCESLGHIRSRSVDERWRKIMLHLIWYIVVGLIAGIIAKSVMHVHMTIFWTIVLGIIGSIIGGAVTHLFSPPTTGRFHPAGLIFSTIGAILVLYLCIKLHIRFPRVL